MQKLAVVHGATSGIGREVALQLAEKGYRILGIGRNETAAFHLKAKLGDRFDFLQADLSLVAENQRVVQAIEERENHIDVLVLSAGMFTDQSWLTPDGLEVNYSTHHLSRFIQAEGLLPLLQKAPHPTLLYISSVGQYKQQKIDLQALPYGVKKGLSTCFRSYIINDFYFQAFAQTHSDIPTIGFNPGPITGTKLGKRSTTPTFIRWINPIFSLVGTDVKKVAIAMVAKVLQEPKKPGVTYYNPKKELPTPAFLLEPTFSEALRNRNSQVINKITTEASEIAKA